jgi:hypothetical protein
MKNLLQNGVFNGFTNVLDGDQQLIFIVKRSSPGLVCAIAEQEEVIGRKTWRTKNTGWAVHPSEGGKKR